MLFTSKSQRENRIYLTLHINVTEAVKILSKKEQKRLEDEEFERVMNEMGTGGDAPQASQEEAK